MGLNGFYTQVEELSDVFGRLAFRNELKNFPLARGACIPALLQLFLDLEGSLNFILAKHYIVG